MRLEGAPLACGCLAISGSKLVGGLSGPTGRCLLGVWDLRTLALERTLKQPNFERFRALAADEGRVWARLKSEVVVWGGGGEAESGSAAPWGWVGWLGGVVAGLVVRKRFRRRFRRAA